MNKTGGRAGGGRGQQVAGSEGGRAGGRGEREGGRDVPYRRPRALSPHVRHVLDRGCSRPSLIFVDEPKPCVSSAGDMSCHTMSTRRRRGQAGHGEEERRRVVSGGPEALWGEEVMGVNNYEHSCAFLS
jgi:hypothetical protein